jgi:hypothetical protein
VSHVAFALDPLIKCAQVLKHVLGLPLVSHLLVLGAASHLFNLPHILLKRLESLLSISLCTRFFHFKQLLRIGSELTQLVV